MVLMDVDDEQAHSGRTALIRAVRSLDETDDLTLPERVYNIWQLLSASKGTRLHSVEETILRWLFKQMAGASQQAEQVRRYPLTWTVLAHAFLKIPPQTLGRVLADRKFTSILRQTLDDVYQSLRQPDAPIHGNGLRTSDAEKSAKKRKRGGESPSDIGQLQTNEGCMKTAVEIFGALGSLLAYNDRFNKAESPEKKVGAEHIKSLFSSSTEETREITAKLLWISDSALSNFENGISQDQQHWVGILTTLWSLHLHSSQDSYEFARHLYQHICSIIAKLKGLAVSTPLLGNQATRNIWLRQLEQFLGAQFIRPVRQRFALDGSVEILKAALAMTASKPFESCIVMWEVAARTPRDSTNATAKLEHASWAQKVFAALLEAIDSTKTPNQSDVIIRLLDIALTTGSIPSTETLRDVCKAHALRQDRTDWALLAKIVKCDSDVFLMDDSILENTLDAISASSQAPDQTDQIVTEVTIALVDAYTRARNLSGFIKQWFKRLRDSSSQASKPLDQTIWFDVRIRQHLASILQSALSKTQLSRLLDWIDSQIQDDGALLVVLDGICAGISREEYIKEVDSRIFTMVLQGKSYKELPSELAALRWHIVNHLASWETSDEINRLWAEVKPSLAAVLKNKPLSDSETIEAFSCSCRLLLANHPVGNDEVELTQLARSFIERLISALDSSETVLSLQCYLELIFRELPRLAELPKPDCNVFSDLIIALSRRIEQEPDARVHIDSQVRKLLHLLITNPDVEDEEPVADALISQPLDAITSETGCGWTQPQSISEICTLLEFPTEALTRKRRKRIMSSWKSWKTEISAQAFTDPSYAIAVLRLLVKVMQQPTFYEKMEFEDLVHIASNLMHNKPSRLGLIEKLIDLTLRHVVSNVEELSIRYLGEASRYVEGIKTSKQSPAQMVLVKSLASVLKSAPNSKSLSTAIDLGKVTRKLRKMVEHSLSKSANEYKSQAVIEAGEDSITLEVTLSAVDSLSDTLADKAVVLQDEAITQLEAAAESYVAQEKNAGWKLRKFLVANYSKKYKETYLLSWLEETIETRAEDAVYELVETFTKVNNSATKVRLLNELVHSSKSTSGSLGALLAVKKIIEQQESSALSTQCDDGAVDVAAVHEQLASLLTKTETIRHFNHLSDILLLLLEKHGNSMTQFCIELTLNSVINVCSPQGPNLQEAKAAGQVYDRSYKLVATVIKRHRRRLEGHFPILIATLQAMLRVLLTDPHSPQAYRHPHSHAKRQHPPWLTAKLQARHAARFARLLTLICEPSAASVVAVGSSRASTQQLDSATDAAKRAAGLDMHAVLETYIKLQLESGGADVSRDVRKALEPGFYAVLDITPQGQRRVLSESLDANGRALFRQMYGDYRKFGRWTGI